MEMAAKAEVVVEVVEEVEEAHGIMITVEAVDMVAVEAEGEGGFDHWK